MSVNRLRVSVCRNPFNHSLLVTAVTSGRAAAAAAAAADKAQHL